MMEHRRSFLGLLLLAWPFGRAARMEAAPSAVAAGSSSAVVEEALEQAVAAFVAAVMTHDKDLTFQTHDLDGKELPDEEKPPYKLKEACRPDFEDCLQGSDAEARARWMRVRERVLRMATWIGVSACAVREARGDVKRKVIFRFDVRAGLEFVSEYCNLECEPTGGGKERERRAYCSGAVAKWGDERKPSDAI